MAPMQFWAELFPRRVDAPTGRAGRGGQNRQTNAGLNSFRAMLKWTRDMAPLVAGVMLHLR